MPAFCPTCRGLFLSGPKLEELCLGATAVLRDFTANIVCYSGELLSFPGFTRDVCDLNTKMLSNAAGLKKRWRGIVAIH